MERKEQGTKGGTKPALSSRIMQLKFMQRATEKKNLAELEKNRNNNSNNNNVDGDKVNNSAAAVEVPSGPCRVLIEGDPLPAAVATGRFSFSFTPLGEREAQVAMDLAAATRDKQETWEAAGDAVGVDDTGGGGIGRRRDGKRKDTKTKSEALTNGCKALQMYDGSARKKQKKTKT